MAVFEQGFPVPVPDVGVPVSIRESRVLDCYAVEEVSYGDIISRYSPTVALGFAPGNGHTCAYCMVDENKGVVVYGISGQIYLSTFSILPNGTMSFGTATNSGHAGGNQSIVFLDSNRFVVACHPMVFIFSANFTAGTVTLLSGPVTVSGATGGLVADIALIESDKLLFVTTSSDYYIATTYSNNIVIGTVYADSRLTRAGNLVRYDSTTFIHAKKDGSNWVYLNVLRVSGTTITNNYSISVGSGSVMPTGFVRVSENEYVFSLTNTAYKYDTHMYLIQFNGTTLSVIKELTFNNSVVRSNLFESYATSLMPLSGGRLGFVSHYFLGSNSGYRILVELLTLSYADGQLRLITRRFLGEGSVTYFQTIGETTVLSITSYNTDSSWPDYGYKARVLSNRMVNVFGATFSSLFGCEPSDSSAVAGMALTPAKIGGTFKARVWE